MFCPHCAHQVDETSESCPHCGFTIAGADAVYGQPPTLELGVNDHGGVLAPEETQAILARLARLTSRYPQIRPAILTVAVGPDTSLPALATWLLNRAGLFSSGETGGMNRGILVAVATPSGRASIQIGYGLEPFLGYRHLENILESARSDFHHGQFGRGILSIITETERVLEEVHGKLEKTYGIDLEAIKTSEARRIGLTRAAELQIPSPSETSVDAY